MGIFNYIRKTRRASERRKATRGAAARAQNGRSSEPEELDELEEFPHCATEDDHLARVQELLNRGGYETVVLGRGARGRRA
jgi:hypothetical protein